MAISWVSGWSYRQRTVARLARIQTPLLSRLEGHLFVLVLGIAVRDMVRGTKGPSSLWHVKRALRYTRSRSSCTPTRQVSASTSSLRTFNKSNLIFIAESAFRGDLHGMDTISRERARPRTEAQPPWMFALKLSL